MFNLIIYCFFISSLAFLISLWCNSWIRKLAIKFDITDKPKLNPSRKFQKKPVPLLGGIGICLGVLTFLIGLWVWQSLNLETFNLVFTQGNIEPIIPKINFGFLILSIILIIVGGFVDDKYSLKAKWMFIPINLAIISAVFGADIKIETLSYPFDTFLIPIISQLPVISYLLAYLWIGFCLAATKFLDGLDGLVTSVGIIGFLVIASISLFANVWQPLVFLLAMVSALATAGFLPFNFPNAKSYLGESGAQIIGFLIGVLSLISGAKIATASLVLGWFIIDIILVMSARIWQKKSPFEGGREHWHFRLQKLGLNKLQVLVLTSFILVLSAILALTLPTNQKIFVLFLQLFFLPISFIFWIKQNSNPNSKTANQNQNQK